MPRNKRSKGKSMFFTCLKDKNVATTKENMHPKTIFNFLREINIKINKEEEELEVIEDFDNLMITNDDTNKQQIHQQQKSSDNQQQQLKPKRILVRPKIEQKIDCGRTFLYTFYGMYVLPLKYDVLSFDVMQFDENLSDKRTIDIVTKNKQHVFVDIHCFERKVVLNLLSEWLLLK